MKIHIVCYEDLDAWILGKFAKKLQEELTKLGVECTISKKPDLAADINHHITYFFYDGKKSSLDTIMITHVDCIQKVLQIKNQLNAAQMGICMSRETTNQLIEAGLPKERLCYINPAQDGIIKPRKIILGLTHKTHHDNRKNPYDLIKICNAIKPEDFSFKIMGSGWEDIVKTMQAKGFTVEYYDHFDKNIYNDLIPSLDYYIFYGFDEGSMGYLDALAAGVKTIVTPQGYHLDTNCGITHPIRNIDEIIETLKNIADSRKLVTDSVKDWNWSNYANKHLALWKELLNNGHVAQNVNPQITNNKTVSLKGIFFYTFRRLTIMTLLWQITPEAIRKYYKKKHYRSS